MYPVKTHTGIGLEAYGEIDERKHIIGPMLYHETKLLGREFEFGLGWLAGLSENAAEGTFLLQLGIILGAD